MALEVKIPAAGESINTATVGQWHKSDGEPVAKGEVLATIETDKVSSELEAPVDGVIKIVVAEGEEVAIGTVIAEITEKVDVEGSSVSGQSGPGEDNLSGEVVAEEVVSNEEPESDQSGPFGFTALDGGPEIIAIKVPAAGESIASATIAQWHKRDGENVEAGDTLVTLETDKVSAEIDAESAGLLNILSPEGMEVSIGAVIGTVTVGVMPPADVDVPSDHSTAGEPEVLTPSEPEQQQSSPVVESDVQRASSAAAALLSSSLLSEKTAQDGGSSQSERTHGDSGDLSDADEGRTTRRRMTPLRRKIATQLVNAQQTAAILTTFNEVDMSAVMQLRKTVQESFLEKYGVKLGFMSLFVKAVVHALREVPSLNGRIEGQEIIENHFYDIGIAVGTEKGLVVPVIRDAEAKDCPQIEQDILDYAERAREGKIQLEDLRGGVFTISNGGIYGSLLSTPILNPPQSGILGMHTIQERPVAVDGKVEIRPMMYLALSYDHRMVDGKEAVTFLIKVKECLENPASLLLEL